MCRTVLINCLAFLVNKAFYIRKSITASLVFSFHKLKSGQNVKVKCLGHGNPPKWRKANNTPFRVAQCQQNCRSAGSKVLKRFTVSLALKAKQQWFQQTLEGLQRMHKKLKDHSITLLGTSEQFSSTAAEDLQGYSSTPSLSQ